MKEACCSGHLDVVRALLSAPPPARGIDSELATKAISSACACFNAWNTDPKEWDQAVEIVDALIKAGADVNAAGQRLRRPIHYLADPPPPRRRGGADRFDGGERFEPLWVRWERLDAKFRALRLLADAGADLDAVAGNGKTALMLSLTGLKPLNENVGIDDIILYGRPSAFEDRPAGPAEFATALISLGASSGLPPGTNCCACAQRAEVRAVITGAALARKRAEAARAQVATKRAAVARKRAKLAAKVAAEAEAAMAAVVVV